LFLEHEDVSKRERILKLTPLNKNEIRELFNAELSFPNLEVFILETFLRGK
jgi:hypothetical protein